MGRGEIWGAIDPKLKTKKHVLGPPHMPNMVKIGLRVWAGPIFTYIGLSIGYSA